MTDSSTSQNRQLVDGRVYASAALLAIMFASLWALPATLDAMVRDPFGLSNSDTSLILQVGSLASVLMGLIIGLLSDRIGRRVPLIVGALLLGGVTTSLLPHLAVFEVLLAVRFVDSALGTIAITLLMTRGVDLSSPSNRSRSMGILMIAIPAGYLLGPALVMTLGRWHLGWLFAALGLLQVIGGLYAALELRRPETVSRMAPSPTEIWRVIVSLPRTWLPMLFGMVDKFSFAAIALLTPLVLADEALGSMGVIGISAVFTFYNVAFIIASPIAGRLVARWGSRPTVIAASFLYGVALIAMGSATSVPMFAALMAACGVLTAFQFVPNMTLVGDLSGVTHRATVMSVFNMLGSLAMLAGFAILGHLSDTSYASAYQLTGLLEICCALIGLVALGVSFATRPRRVRGMPEAAVAREASFSGDRRS